MNIEEISSRFIGRKKSSKGYTALCPAHEDKKNSLSIFIADNDKNKIVVKCHAGCDTKEILAKVKLELSDLYIEKLSKFSENKDSTIYDYKDEHGVLIHQTVRTYPKGFKQRRPDGQGDWIWNLKGIETILFNLSDVIKSKKENKIIVVVEGEKDAENLISLGITATTCAGGGASKWKSDYNVYFENRKVIIFPDNDVVGKQHAQNVFNEISTVTKTVSILSLQELKDKEDVSDYINNQRQLKKSDSEISAELNKLMSGCFSNKINEITYSTWEDLNSIISDVSWSWEKWLPNGLLTILASESGKGKSYLALKIASSFITGEPFPDGTKLQGEQIGKILWCEAEASQAVNLQRAKQWGLNLQNIISPFSNPSDEIVLDNLEHRKILSKIATLPEIKIIVIDSLSGANSRDENKKEVSEIVKYLAELARNTNKPILLVHHLNKPVMGIENQPVTLNRLRGSSSIIQYARVVWAIDSPNNNDTEHRRLSVIKSNLSRFPEPIGFKIDDGNDFSFTQAPEAPKQKKQFDKAMEFLRDFLKDGRKWQTEIEDEAKKINISFDTVRKAKSALGAASYRDGNLRQWYWELKND